jgi:hypothetical protein
MARLKFGSGSLEVSLAQEESVSSQIEIVEKIVEVPVEVEKLVEVPVEKLVVQEKVVEKEVHVLVEQDLFHIHAKLQELEDNTESSYQKVRKLLDSHDHDIENLGIRVFDSENITDKTVLPKLDVLEDKLIQLEKQNRTQKVVNVGLILTLILLIFL